MIVWNGMDIIVLIVGGVALLFCIGLIVIKSIPKKSKERRKKEKKNESRKDY